MTGCVAGTDTGNIPLTTLQSSMALTTRIAPHAGYYIVQDVCEVRHALRPADLRRAWGAVAQRHRSLRAALVFEPVSGEPRLEASSGPVDDRVEWREEDWAGSISGEQEHEAALERMLRNLFAEGFDAGLPYRFTILRHAPEWWTIIWTCHHVILDGRSMVLAWREWFAEYDSQEPPEASPVMDEAPVVSEANLKNAAALRRAYLDGLDPEAGRVVDRMARRDPAVPGDTGKVIRRLNAAETAALRTAASDTSAVSTVIYSAWALLLSTCRGGHSTPGDKDEVLFGVARSGRPSSHSGIGCYIHTAPLRVRLPADQKVGAWLRDLRAAWNGLRGHEHLPLSTGEAQLSFDSLVAYEHQTVEQAAATAFGGDRGHGRRTRTLRRFQRTDLPLTLAAYGGSGPDANEMQLELIYARHRYSPRFVEGLIDQLLTILRDLPHRLKEPLRSVRVLPEALEASLWSGSAGPSMQIPGDWESVASVFAQRVREQPDLPAVSELSYAGLNARANRLAWRLLRHGNLRPGGVVAMLLPRGTEAVVAALAILKAGGVSLPLDPNQPPERLRMLLRILPASITVDQEVVRETGVDPSLPTSDPPLPARSRRDAAYAIFTSGSTGTPKAVLVPHGALLNHSLAAARVYGITASDRRLLFASPGADVFFAEVFIYLCAGACLVDCLEPGPPTFAQFTRALQEHSVTITGIPASWWKEWMSGPATVLPPTLRAMICGMERLDVSALARWRQLAGGRVRLFNAYGPAENSPTSLIYEFGTSAWEDESSYAPVGRPISNTQAFLLACGSNRLVPPGTEGELCLAGADLALGYHGAEEESQRRFSAHALDANRRMYRTGDLAFQLPDGNFVFLGRLDQQMKVRGYRLEPEEVEGVLQLHPAVGEAAVGVQDNGDLAAFVTAASALTPPDLATLQAHCREWLPAHQIPSAFFLAASMPRATGGKLDRAALVRGEAGSSVRLYRTTGFRPPTQQSQIRLATIWERVLALDTTPGLDQDFFELGGNSLATTRLIAAMGDAFGVELSVPDLLRHPTLESMARLCEAGVTPDTCGQDRLIALRRASGANIPGSRIPLVAICCTPEDLHAFRLLTTHLPASQPVFLVDAVAHWQGPLETVEAIATRVVRLIDSQVFPRGGYTLAGFCYAGIVAYEAARIFAENPVDGRVPARVALFDVFRPGTPVALKTAQGYLRLLKAGLAQVGSLSFQEIGNHLQFAAAMVQRRWQAGSDTRNAASTAPTVDVATMTLGAWLGRSAAMYDPPPTTVPCVQFLSRDTAITTRVLDDPRLTWRDRCLGGFTVCEVAGSHATLFTDAHLAALSAEFQAATAR